MCVCELVSGCARPTWYATLKYMYKKKFTNICDNTEAVKMWPTNAVYYSNRAAAYTHMHMYDEAIAGPKKKRTFYISKKITLYISIR
jgi:hypothetical protein